METIDFEELKWGSFTKQFNAYHKKHPSIKSLEQFANYIISNPTKFQPITKKRANFYLNVILRGDPVIPPFSVSSFSKRTKKGGLLQSEKIKIAKEIKPITKEEAIKSYLELEKDKNLPITSTKGNKFVDYFTFLERLETIGNKGISFWEFWDKKTEYMKKNYVSNLIKHYQEKRSDNEVKNLYNTFRLYFGSVGIFKPVIAMEVYNKYKPTSILDFTMGWGGRLVGASALNIPNYIGIDLNTNLQKPYYEMIETLKQIGTKTHFTLIFKDALKVDYSKLNYDMVFTSPPYYNTEIYRGTKKMTEEEWNDKFYKPLISETWKYLKQGGHYILNVPISVYNNVLINLLGTADKIIPMNTSRGMSDKLKQKEYKEFIYVWNKNEKRGGSIETDDFEERGIVSLPEFRSIHLNLPTYMYKRLPDIKGKPPPYRYKLVIPITKARHLSSRNLETSIDLNQKPLSRPVINIDDPSAIPILEEFSPSDRTKIQEYYYNVKQNDKKKVDKIDKDTYKVVPRGFPLPCGGPKVAKPKPVKKVAVPTIIENLPKSKSISKSKSVSSVSSESNIPKSKSSSSLKSPSLLSSFDPDEELRKVLEGFGINKILSNNNMPNAWITYVKNYASKNGINYREALRDPNCKAGYKKGTGCKNSKGVVPEEEISGGVRVLPTNNEFIHYTNQMLRYQLKAKQLALNKFIISRDETEFDGITPPEVNAAKTKHIEKLIEDIKKIREELRNRNEPEVVVGEGLKKKGKGIIDESEFADQTLLAEAYNSTQLGANGGKKFISL